MSTMSPAQGTETAPQRRTFWQQLALIGPAFVVGAWQFGPGNLTTAVQAGSKYLYALIWVIVVSTILMIFLSDMSVRLGIKTPVSLISSIKDELGKGWGYLAGVGIFFICLMFSVGNATGSGLGLSMVFGGSPIMWTAICTILVASLLFLKNVYAVVEKILVAIVAIMAIAFVASAFAAHPDWAAAGRGLVPVIPADSWMLIIALTGTNFSVNAAFFASYGTHERKRTVADYRDVTMVDTIPGIVAPGIMTALVIIVSAAVLGQTGQDANSIAGLAKVFEPIAGPAGAMIFSIGFFGAAISSMIANATAGGTMLSDALGHGASANSKAARIVSGIILAFGLAVALIFQGSPVQLIVTAQALTILVAPILATLIVVMSNRRNLMQEFTNKWYQNLFGIIGLVAVFALSARLLMNLIK